MPSLTRGEYPALDDGTQRYSEGWIFSFDGISRALGSKFASEEEEALAFVKRRADEGSEYHRQVKRLTR